MTQTNSLSVLFVCMGNICRSPKAHGVFRQKVIDHGLASQVAVDSAGTHNHHPDSPPDEQSQAHAAKRAITGPCSQTSDHRPMQPNERSQAHAAKPAYDLSDLRARQIQDEDFQRYDLILVIDWDNLAFMQDACPPKYRAKVRRLTKFCSRYDSPVVPDPYYSGSHGFDHVLDLVEDACEGLNKHIRQEFAST